MGFDVTAIVTIKHAALRQAAKKMGSAKKLADHLGVRYESLSSWCSLRKVPPRRSDIENGRYKGKLTVRQLEEIEAKLLDLTGKLLDELFPDDLRETVNGSSKSFEITKNIEASQLLRYAAQTTQRLESLPGPVQAAESIELKTTIEDALRFLTTRERQIVVTRWGLDGRASKTLEQTAAEFGLTTERIRQLEQRAIVRLKNTHLLDVFVEGVGE